MSEWNAGSREADLFRPAGPRERVGDGLASTLFHLRWPLAMATLGSAVALGLRLASLRAGIPFRWRLESPAGMALTLLAGLALPVLIAAVRRPWRSSAGLTPLARLAAAPTYVGETLLTVVAVFTSAVAAVNLARQLASWNERLFDSPVWRLDASLGLGRSPVADLSEVLAAAGWLGTVDQIGPVLFALAPLALALLWVREDLAPQRWRATVAFVLIGAALGALRLAWPTLGPAAYRPSQFPWLDQAPLARMAIESGLRQAARLREAAWAPVESSFDGLVAGPDGRVALLVAVALAAGLPSWAGGAGLLLAGACGLCGVSLGFHYVVDVLAGAALGAGAWLVAQALVSSAEPLLAPRERAGVEGELESGGLDERRDPEGNVAPAGCAAGAGSNDRGAPGEERRRGAGSW